MKWPFSIKKNKISIFKCKCDPLIYIHIFPLNEKKCSKCAAGRVVAFTVHAVIILHICQLNK